MERQSGIFSCCDANCDNYGYFSSIGADPRHELNTTATKLSHPNKLQKIVFEILYHFPNSWIALANDTRTAGVPAYHGGCTNYHRGCNT